MKRYAFIIIFAGIVLLALLAVSGRAEKPPVQKAVVQFDEPVKLLTVTLKGEYLFVHDEEKMARGDDCTYVYTHSKGKQGELVISCHCVPVTRDKTDNFTISVTMQPGTDLTMLTEYRFAGSTQGHKVPSPK